MGANAVSRNEPLSLKIVRRFALSTVVLGFGTIIFAYAHEQSMAEVVLRSAKCTPVEFVIKRGSMGLMLKCDGDRDLFTDDTDELVALFGFNSVLNIQEAGKLSARTCSITRGGKPVKCR